MQMQIAIRAYNVVHLDAFGSAPLHVLRPAEVVILHVHICVVLQAVFQSNSAAQHGSTGCVRACTHFEVVYCHPLAPTCTMVSLVSVQL